VARNAFLDRPATAVATSEGAVDLPLVVRDFESLALVFGVDHAAAQRVLADSPFAPIRVAPGRALVMLAFLNFRDGGLGAYRECALMTAVVRREREGRTVALLDLVRRAAHRDVGFHILDLPVTTARSMAAGREIWSLPKFVTAIEVGLGIGRARCSVEAPGTGERLVSVEGAVGRGIRLPSLDYVLYSVRSGATLRTLVEIRGPIHTSLGGGLTVRVAGSSPMASRLTALGLDGARPRLVQACRRGQMVLHAAEPVAQARAA
jgi:acetoacetate decarboxylase